MINMTITSIFQFDHYITLGNPTWWNNQSHNMVVQNINREE